MPDDNIGEPMLCETCRVVSKDGVGRVRIIRKEDREEYLKKGFKDAADTEPDLKPDPEPEPELTFEPVAEVQHPQPKTAKKKKKG